MHNAALTIVTSPKHDKILLVKRKDIPIWVLPGGGIDVGETPENAAIRELKEETGLLVSALQHTVSLLPINTLSAPTDIFLTFLPEKHLLSHHFFDSSNECDEVSVFSINALPKTLFPLHKKWIEEVLTAAKKGGSFFPYTRAMKEVTYFWFLKILVLHPVFSFRYFFSRLIKISKLFWNNKE